MKYRKILKYYALTVSILVSTTFASDIHNVSANGDLEKVKLLLKDNPKLAMRFNDVNDLPIRAAILNGHTEIAKILISYMDDVDAKNIRAMTPLIYASSVGNVEIIKLLIDKGANVDHKNAEGRSSLFYAVMQGKISAVEQLIASGAEIDIKTNSGDTPLRVAIERNNLDMINLLVSKKVHLDIRDEDDGIQLLHKLSTMGQEKLVTQLVEQGVNIRSRDRMNRTLLHSASAGGLNALISKLIRSGMNVNTTDIYGSTPLHESVYFSQKDTIEILLSNCAYINSTRPDGSTPLHLARDLNKQYIIDLLLSRGAEDKKRSFPKLSGDYLGQKTPRDIGIIFAPGIISKAESAESLRGFYEMNSFAIYYQEPYDLKVDYCQWPYYLAKRVNNVWEVPFQSKLLCKPWFYNLESVPKGERMIFAWRRNLDGSGPPNELYLWSATKTSNGWTEPTRFETPINQGFDTRPSLSNDKTLYFHSWRAGTYGRDDIYMSKLENGEYRTVQNLGEVINTEYIEHDAYIAPDSSYILFSSFKPGGYGEDDIYVSYKRKDGTWSKPVNLGGKINSRASDNRVAVSIDGKYLFYTSTRTGNLDIYYNGPGLLDQ